MRPEFGVRALNFPLRFLQETAIALYAFRVVASARGKKNQMEAIILLERVQICGY
jgi:hypothetical protein